MIRGPKIKVHSNEHINKGFLGIVEKWEPVLGPQDPRNPQDHWELQGPPDHQDPRTSSTSGFGGTPGTPKTSGPLDL